MISTIILGRIIMRRIIVIIVAGLTCLGLSACTPNESQPTATVTMTVTAPSDTTTPTGDVTSMLFIKGRTIVCGINVCPDAAIVAVRVTVSGTSVLAEVCAGQEFNSNDEESLKTCTGMSGETHDWEQWTGTLEGSKAIVTDTTYPSKYRWAIMAFGSDLQATAFITGDHCELVDGSHGHLSDDPDSMPHCD